MDAQTQADIEARIAKAGIKPPDTYVLEHGYCRSVYVTDPNGLILEFTLDPPHVAEINKERRADARQSLEALAGGRSSFQQHLSLSRCKGFRAMSSRIDRITDYARG